MAEWEEPRNMKSMQLNLAAIFLCLILTGLREGSWTLGSPGSVIEITVYAFSPLEYINIQHLPNFLSAFKILLRIDEKIWDNLQFYQKQRVVTPCVGCSTKMSVKVAGKSIKNRIMEFSLNVSVTKNLN